jgi:NADPH-dependent ferric siderophore reductase
MDLISVETHRSRFPGVARSTGMDCREVPPLRSRRAYAAGLEAAAPVIAASLADWARKFDEPIPVPKGRRLVTLRDAGDYIAKLPKAKYLTAEWQAAMFALMLVVDLNGPTMIARIGIMRALKRHVERVFDPSWKDTNWGKRKMVRDH